MATAEEVTAKIDYLLKNRLEVSESELKLELKEVREFLSALPEKERGDFYWNSGLECLAMLETPDELENYKGEPK